MCFRRSVGQVAVMNYFYIARAGRVCRCNGCRPPPKLGKAHFEEVVSPKKAF